MEQLAGKADLCLIPTGIPLHRPMTVAAVEAGMHVLDARNRWAGALVVDGVAPHRPAPHVHALGPLPESQDQ